MNPEDLERVAEEWIEKIAPGIPSDLQNMVGFIARSIVEVLSGKRTVDDLVGEVDESLIEELIRRGQGPEDFLKRIELLVEIVRKHDRAQQQELLPVICELQMKALEKVLRVYSRITAGEVLARKRAERAYRVLNAVNEVIIKAEGEKKMLEDVCRVIVEVGGYKHAWIGYAENGRVIRLAAKYGYSREEPEKQRNSLTGSEDTEPSADLSADDDCSPCIKMAEREGFASSIALPLKYDGDIYGVLNIYAPESDVFDDQEVDLLTKLAENISYAISKIRTEAEKKKIDQLYRLLVDNTGTAILLIEDGRVVFANRRAEELSGYSKEQLIGKPFIELVCEKDREKVMRMHRMRLENPDSVPQSYRLNYVDSAGNMRSGVAIVAKVPESSKFIVSVIDITDLMLAIGQIEENIEKFAILVDKIRNPLAAIHGYVEEYVEDETLREKIFEQIARIVKLVNQLEDGWMESENVRMFLRKFER
ncbi:PAS domain S-box protein [Geoglobus acetivorans]|uniref:PAS domain S-box protein n=1 Tax=Geoglobus acetivorans TaxID=565033 RepID=A0ABZ3H526_GEOAI|nr:PAS domain S-box protein [Geoglobus acetivorans]